MKQRIEIPVNDPAGALDLVKKVRAKHEADGDASPLKLLDWTKTIPDIEDAIISHETAKQLDRTSKELYQRRDRSLETVFDILRDSRDILTGIYKKNMKVLGQWGFNVFELSRSKKKSEDTPPKA